jgi:hypothetical protein
MVWVYDRTESLLLAMLMHGSATGGLVFRHGRFGSYDGSCTISG